MIYIAELIQLIRTKFMLEQLISGVQLMEQLFRISQMDMAADMFTLISTFYSSIQQIQIQLCPAMMEVSGYQLTVEIHSQTLIKILP